MDPPAPAASDAPLAGERVFLLSKLVSMPRGEAVRLLEASGAEVVSRLDAGVTITVVGEETEDWRTLLETTMRDAGAAPSAGRVLRETELWRHAGLIDDDEGERLYTPAMLADLVAVPVTAIRRWRRRSYLLPAREVGRLPYFAMAEVHVARRLAGLLEESGSLPRVDRLVAQLTAAAPDVDRPLAELAVVVMQGRVYLRRGADLTEPHGQLLLDFEQAEEDDDETTHAEDDAALLLPLALPPDEQDEDLPTVLSIEETRLLALERQATGDTAGAIEACRATLFAGGDAEDHALLAELLYRTGDVAAARERYYTALEIDPGDVESRVSLGCLLAETGDLPLAAAAFRGAAGQQPGFADAHYHLAKTLDDLGETREAEQQWRRFLEVAPAGPWAEEAEARLGVPSV